MAIPGQPGQPGQPGPTEAMPLGERNIQPAQQETAAGDSVGTPDDLANLLAGKEARTQVQPPPVENIEYTEEQKRRDELRPQADKALETIRKDISSERFIGEASPQLEKLQREIDRLSNLPNPTHEDIEQLEGALSRYDNIKETAEDGGERIRGDAFQSKKYDSGEGQGGGLDEEEKSFSQLMNDFDDAVRDGDVDLARKLLRQANGSKGFNSRQYDNMRGDYRDLERATKAEKKAAEEKEKADKETAAKRRANNIVLDIEEKPNPTANDTRQALDDIANLENLPDEQRESAMRRIRTVDNARKEKERKSQERKVDRNFQLERNNKYIQDVLLSPDGISVEDQREAFYTAQDMGTIPEDKNFDQEVLDPIRRQVEASVVGKYSAGDLANPNAAKGELDAYVAGGYIEQNEADRIMGKVYERQVRMVDELLAREARGEAIKLEDIKDETVKKEFEKRARQRAEKSPAVSDLMEKAKKFMKGKRGLATVDWVKGNLKKELANLSPVEKQVAEEQLNEYSQMMTELDKSTRELITESGGNVSIPGVEGGSKEVKYDLLNIDAIVAKLNLSDSAKANIKEELKAEQRVRIAEMKMRAREAAVAMDKQRRANLALQLSKLKHYGTALAIFAIPTIGPGLLLGGAGFAAGGIGLGLLAGSFTGSLALLPAGAATYIYDRYYGRRKIDEMELQVDKEKLALEKAEKEIRRIVADASLWSREKAAAAYAAQTGKDVNETIQTYMQLTNVDTISVLRRDLNASAASQFAAAA
ncbi:hypothetical protein JW978_02210 [Candidatus Dojkabacteria bacterium]|nr:hypothetical protein [Candidatus Dojkabacteria bacterium]